MFPRIAHFKTVTEFKGRLATLGINLPVDDRPLSRAEGSPLAQPLVVCGIELGNRWCIQPMEGWDGTADGQPSELTRRRWRNFGTSGAKLIWGGEAAAVQADGRANPNQLLATPRQESALASLLAELRASHRDTVGSDHDLLVGLQLTHSGRFARPHGKRLEPRIAYHHPLLDRKFGIAPDDTSVVWSDDDLERLCDQYVSAAGVAARAGFQFVDVKACHGYLLHEFLSARTRTGRFGGDFTGRTRLLSAIVARIRDTHPKLQVGVRLSAFDTPPYELFDSAARPMPHAEILPYQFGFGVNPDLPSEIDLTEPLQLLRHLRELGVRLFNITCGSPYYNPHVQRPAAFPPSDGYPPPEDPLLGVWRQIETTRQIKASLADCAVVGSGYSYLQDYLVHVAQAAVRDGWVDCAGLGRMVLAYPELPAVSLAGERIERKQLCRTFSDCTTAPRQGLVSGCYPLDLLYKRRPEAEQLKRAKRDRSNQSPNGAD